MTTYEVREADQLDDVRPPELAARVVGHVAAQARVDELIGARRIPGAFLINGPRGIGKATLAFDMARRILAATSDEELPRIAEQIASGAHPNVFVLRMRPRETGKGFYTQITVDQVARRRERQNAVTDPLRDRLHQTRGRAGYRIAIVDSIDDCNDSAANALLKILEEPPPETVFLLVSHRPGTLLPTIRSRCHLLALRTLADDDVRAIVSDQRADTDPTAIDRAVGLAGGRPRRAFEALGMDDSGQLGKLQDWLIAPGEAPSAAHLGLADKLGANREGAEFAFARDLILDWMATEGADAARSGDRAKLASITALWEKAGALFADTAELNLDARQTLTVIFDAIRRHVRISVPVA